MDVQDQFESLFVAWWKGPGHISIFLEGFVFPHFQKVLALLNNLFNHISPWTVYMLTWPANIIVCTLKPQPNCVRDTFQLTILFVTLQGHLVCPMEVTHRIENPSLEHIWRWQVSNFLSLFLFVDMQCFLPRLVDRFGFLLQNLELEQIQPVLDHWVPLPATLNLQEVNKMFQS